MSLQVEDSSRRGRSKSPSGRDRSSSRIERSPSGRDRKKDRAEPSIVQAPYPANGNADDLDDPRKSTRIVEYDDYRGSATVQPARSSGATESKNTQKYDDVNIRDGDGHRDKAYRYEKASSRDYERDKVQERGKDSRVSISEDKLAFLPAKYAKKSDTAGGGSSNSSGTGGPSRDKPRDREYERTNRGDRTDRGDRGDRTDRYERTAAEKYDPRDRPSRSSAAPSQRREDISDEDDTSDDDADLAYGKLPPPSRKGFPSSPAHSRDNSRQHDYSKKDSYATFADDKDYGRDPRIVAAEPRGPSDPRDPRSSRDFFPGRDSRDPRSSRDSFSGRDPRDPRSSRESHDPRDDRTYRDDKKYHRDSYGGPDPRTDPRADPRADPRKDPRKDPRSSSSNVLMVDTGASKGRSRSRSRSRSPMPTKDMARLSVGALGAATLGVAAAHHAGGSLSAAPGSPLQESYHGTYQSMSPMPSPLMLPRGSDAAEIQVMDITGPDYDGDEALMSPGGSGGGEKIRRRARFYDPQEDAQRLAKALKGERHAPDTGPLIEILPGLHHDQVMELRHEYKRIVKTGPERKGVNIAKHIRARLKDEDPALMKACYATALGRWESEAYWANFWYHGDKTRRELLIESLMGRTNDEIRNIKESFSDKKYGDSIIKCMRTELKEDKFKRAVLFVLDEQRMEEVSSRDGRPLPVDERLVEEDCVALHHAVVAERGGETAMINVVVQRSDAHLREVLSMYSSQYKGNFARDCLKKSGNLVGEMLAHILNGVINKPVRDALLVHHALTTSKRDELRRELLISRLVRFHWDGNHMLAVKSAYRSRYGKDMQEAIRDATGSSDWGLFCRELCITRHPDDVKRVERIDVRDDRRDERH
ncbi:annexin anxc4 [Ophiostoma piceae UAMH 11346]|uniref:Annexin anxc4 n=1 Tax=Ophiostoma piceae (strain UAMH 11346) TaxID=1262450 RepID=S3C509_OPHP1|nr:annexin anxc4 [Ophiostoma piceae UAMH 11346]